MSRIATMLALAATLFVSGAAQASDPIGGYLIVDKVILEPSDSPTTIQIWGSISLATERGGRAYGNPERGYLYYKIQSGKEEVCRKEWNDLKLVAGTGQVIGFGSSYDLKSLGKIRKGSAKPEAADTYPVANGLVKVPAERNYTPVFELRSLPAPQTPVDGELVPAGEITLIVRNSIDKTHPKVKYVFTLENTTGGKEEATVEAGDKETKWTPKTRLKAGEKYTWRVRAVDGEWKGSVAHSTFVVKGGQ